MSDVVEMPKQSVIPADQLARINKLLVGAIDMHCHSGPSVMPRQLDHVEAMREASGAGMRAILFKDHYYSATPVSEILNKYFADLKVVTLSGVPLNNTSGGINRYAVDHGLKLGARIVWMPTFSAENHIRHNYRHKMLVTKEPMLPPTALRALDDQGRLLDEVKFILDQVAAKDAVLSAGHLHISEILVLFEEAKKRGVNRRVVQHPTYVIDATLQDIKELTEGGAYVEHSLCMFIDESRFKKWTGAQLKEMIKAATVERTILGSDLGQIKNPTPVTGFRHVIKLCLDNGFTDDEIKKLVGGNAAKLLGLD